MNVRADVPDVRWRAPGRAPSAVPALAAGVLAAAAPLIVTAALAFWLARTARREIAASQGQLDGAGFATAAFVLAVYSLIATSALVATALG
jgi:hypothetical protein